MNNILTFEDYRKMNIKQVESVIYRQFIEEDIKDEVNEGIIRKAINKAAGNFIQNALADEIEKGKELEKSIKEALDGLDKGFEEIKKKVSAKSNSKSKLEPIEQVKNAIKAVQSQAFDTLTMIGSEGEIDFAGFMGSATIAATINFGILFSPIRSVFMSRKAYKYFLGIIKQTIRRNLLVIQLNFDQFENLILQKSFETEDDSENITKSNTLHEIISAMTTQLCGKDSKLKMLTGKKGKEMKEYLEAFKKAQDIEFRQHRENYKNNPLSSLWQDQHNNTYTRTLEQIKQYINEDSQKELDSLKNSITKMAGNDPDLMPYGELLISAAEEYAVHTNHGINNNFIKMSSVFNLENQKKLIELIVETQKENEAEIKKKESRREKSALNRKMKKDIKDGKKLYEEKIKGSGDEFDTLDKFEKEFDDNDVRCLKAFFATDEGKDQYKELIEKHPLYKYLIMDDATLNTLLSCINDLKVVEISGIKDFYENIAKKDQTLYYVMAERSIKDAIESKTSESYFGFENISDKVDGDFIKEDIYEDEKKINPILDSIFPTKKTKGKGRPLQIDEKKRYFLTFNGSGGALFDILHKDFKTEIFNSDKNYISDISTESKETIMKLIYKNLKIGNSITTQFAEYLVRLEAHMILEKRDPWFVVENNDALKDCFKIDADKIQNKNAFVEINAEDYDDIKSFLSKYHTFAEKDFDTTSESDAKKEEK